MTAITVAMDALFDELRTTKLEGADPGLDPALRAIAVPNNALPTVRKPLLGKPVEEGPDLGFQHGHEHPPRALPGYLRKRVLDRTRLAQQDDAGIVLHGVSLPLEVLEGSIIRASSNRCRVANAPGRSQPCSGAAWSRAPTFCSSSGRKCIGSKTMSAFS